MTIVLYFSLPTAQVAKPQNSLQYAKSKRKQAKAAHKIIYGEI
jgi:hypothetical protein